MPNDLIPIQLNAIHTPNNMSFSYEPARIKDDNDKEVGQVTPTLSGHIRVSINDPELNQVWMISYRDIWDAVMNATGNSHFSFNKPVTDES